MERVYACSSCMLCALCLERTSRKATYVNVYCAMQARLLHHGFILVPVGWVRYGPVWSGVVHIQRFLFKCSSFLIAVDLPIWTAVSKVLVYCVLVQCHLSLVSASICQNMEMQRKQGVLCEAQNCEDKSNTSVQVVRVALFLTFMSESLALGSSKLKNVS